jgi:hypothetical protein
MYHGTHLDLELASVLKRLIFIVLESDFLQQLFCPATV